MYFNPRTHVGCDQNSNKMSKRILHFNPRTHVGCDGSAGASLSLIFYFNPRTHVGCDLIDTPDSGDGEEFQSTHPRGVRPCELSELESTLLFQSTHPRGVRHDGADLTCEKVLFQSTHPRGVRHPDRKTSLGWWQYFNPRTHVGCDNALK